MNRRATWTSLTNSGEYVAEHAPCRVGAARRRRPEDLDRPSPEHVARVEPEHEPARLAQHVRNQRRLPAILAAPDVDVEPGRMSIEVKATQLYRRPDRGVGHVAARSVGEAKVVDDEAHVGQMATDALVCEVSEVAENDAQS